MALQTSGQISLNDIHVEAGGSSGTQASLNDADIRGLIDKGSGAQMSFSEWYGATAETVLTSAGTVNGQAQQKEITISNFISSGGTFRVPSNMWVWSDQVSVAALTIDIPCTVINEGKIIGKGGEGGSSSTNSYGGDAIKINSGVTGVTITNASGAYIAGGGSGGASQGGNGGGGAGGGGGGGWSSGAVIASAGGNNTGEGGTLNAAGERGSDPYAEYNTNSPGRGGGAGGGGGASNGVPFQWQKGSNGGGGGRILPGTGGAGGNGTANGGTGGSAGNAGGQGGDAGAALTGGGGGGGWGAKGANIPGNYPVYSQPAGKAIDDSGVSYTLSNSGTIYGGT
jgi:hypothetical protein